MPQRRVSAGFRLRPEIALRIRTLADELSVSQASIVEMGVALLGKLTRREMVRLAAKEDQG